MIRKSGQIDYILLETTGLADPYPIINSFWTDEALECRASLDGVICLIDGKNFIGQVKEWQVLMQQLVLADVIVINKIDLITENAQNDLITWIKERNPLAKIQTCQYGYFKDYSSLLDLKAYGAVDCSFAKNQRGYLDLMESLSVNVLAPRDHEDVRSLRLSTRKQINRDLFERWLFTLLWSESDSHKILRAKGLLSVEKGKDIVIQAVQELYEITELDTAKRMEEGVLVFLGWFKDDSVIDSIKQSFYNTIL